MIRLEIDLDAVVANYREVVRRAGGRAIVAVVKGDAYGHGAIEVARALSGAGATLLAAGSLDEAIAIGAAGVTTPLLVLGSVAAEAAPVFVRHNLIASVDDEAGADALARAADRPTPVWVKVDCGFGRYGIGLGAARDFIRGVAARPSLRLQGIYTHLPFADQQGRDWAMQQTRRFQELVATLAAEKIRFDIVQATASPALLTGCPGDDAVAVGHLLYGMNPLADPGFDMAPFRPALRGLVTRLAHRGDRLAGEQAAPYLRGGSGPLGVVPIGLVHGYRPVDPAAFMVVRGVRAPVLRVCVESTIIDLAAAAAASVGDRVTVIGDGVSLHDLARWQQTSPLFLMMDLGRSVPRSWS